MINVELLRKNLEYVTAHRDQWDQSYWIQRTWCGTTACLAGTVVLNEGYRPVPETREQRDVGLVTDSAGSVDWVDNVARKLLGLDESQAYVLFSGTNSLHRLWELASSWTDGAIEVPVDVQDAPSAAELENELVARPY